MAILLAIGIFMCGFVCGWLAVKLIVLARLKNILKAIREEKETEETTTVGLIFERHGDQIYAYTDKTREFMAQGESKEQLVKILTTRFPNTSFTANSKNMEDVGLANNDE